MYLPALAKHPHGKVAAVCGRDPARTAAVAEKWRIPQHFTDWRAMLDSGAVDAVIVSTPNTEHHPITMAALNKGLHVLCEKPMALDYAQAQEMADKAQAAGVKHMLAFTYRWLPSFRYVKHLLDQGYLGQHYHLNMRWYAGGGRRESYRWRSDASVPGAGVLADLGSHWICYARWFFGEISGVSCLTGSFNKREYPVADETALLNVRFASGAVGSLFVSFIAYEGRPQTLQMELHGSGGTLHHMLDWQTLQRVRGAKDGEDIHDISIPEHFWNGARRDAMVNTMHDIFNNQDAMAREWVTAIAKDKPCSPDFVEGARIQQIQDAAAQSAQNNGGWVAV